MRKIDDIRSLLAGVSLVDVLYSFGKDVGHLRRGMCRSPFRDESSPSFRILRRNGIEVWADYGAPLTPADISAGRKVHGGGVLDLVMELGGLSRSEAVDYVASMSSGHLVLSDGDVSCKRSERSLVVDSVSDVFTRRSLIDYACIERCIPRDVLNRWCSEVSVHLDGTSGRRSFRIGFPNDSGGWILRGPGSGFLSKASTSSDITTLSAGGAFCPLGSESDRVFVFEGFFDFLSWMSWGGRVEPGFDVCVLNSVSNLSRAFSWISAHSEVGVCFDNDPAGRDALSLLRHSCPGVFVKDCSSSYSEFNDLNEMYVSLCRSRVRSITP